MLICFWFLNYVDTFTHCPMTANFVKNLTQLRVYWTTEWEMWLSNLRRLWTRGPWNPTLDRVHKPLSWTGSMHPLSWTGSMDSFFYRGRSRGRVQGVRTPPEMTSGFLIQLVFRQKKKTTMWFIGVEVEQETSAPPPKKNPGSAPVLTNEKWTKTEIVQE